MSEPVWTTGGRGGTTAVLDDLDVAVAALTDAAAELDDAATVLAIASGIAASDPARLVLAPALAATAASCSGEAAALRGVAASVAAAARGYLDAEARARVGIALAERVNEGIDDAVGTAVWADGVARDALGILSGVTPLVAWAMGAPVGIDLGTGPPVSSWLNRGTTEAALARIDAQYDEITRALSAALRAIEVLEADYLAVEEGERLAIEPPGGVRDLLARMAWIEGMGDGSVAIETIDGSRGRRHVVYVPGTQDALLAPNQADMQANLSSVTGGPSDAAAAVVDAMAAHGIAPGEPVMLAGHSQGGMVAMVAANALRGRYKITHVVTVGSPTGRIGLPTQVQALHLENTRDPVPGLDGRANPDTPNRVTVHHDRRRTERVDTPDRSRTLPQSHALAGYSQTASLVDEGLGESTDAWRAGARDFLGGDDARLTAYRPVTE